MTIARKQYENYLFINQAPYLTFEEWHREVYNPNSDRFITKQREEIIKKWEAAGLLDNLDKYKPKENLALLLDGAQSCLLNVGDLMESLEELDTYLIMLSEMKNVGIRRKISLLEDYMVNIKNKINR